MSKTINVRVREKIATADAAAYYVCGNSDYIIAFDFDEEWSAYEVKTARFVYNGEPVDVVFAGDSVAVPIIENTYNFTVGVFAGNLHTTTPAYVPAKKSILCGGGTPKPPREDVYAQITALCNEAVSEAKSVRNDADNGKFDGAPGKTPVAGEDYFTEADKQAIASEAADAVGFPHPTSAEDGKFLGCEDGKAAWLPVEASGGKNQWYTVSDFTLSEEINNVVVSADEGGTPIENYNPIGIGVYLYVPADSTQPTTSGNVWAYPSITLRGNEIRSNINVASWTTTSRMLTVMFLGNEKVLVSLGSVSYALNPSYDQTFKIDGVRLYINNPDSNGHLPVGTRIIVAVLGAKT